MVVLVGVIFFEPNFFGFWYSDVVWYEFERVCELVIVGESAAELPDGLAEWFGEMWVEYEYIVGPIKIGQMVGDDGEWSGGDFEKLLWCEKFWVECFVPDVI